MISCTDYIPAYSQLFTYLDQKFGRDEVDRYWNYAFEPTAEKSPLFTFLQREGLKGCWSYWKGSLNEEAADFTMYLNEKRGFYHNVMHWCPSKGRLLKLKDELGVEPYYDYCLHCDLYRKAVEKNGLKYIYNFNGTNKAACSMLIYDPDVFDGRVIIDEDTLIMDRKASDNEYFHKAFHNSLNKGLTYLGTTHGDEAVREFLVQYTRNVWAHVMKAMEEKGLAAIEEMIRDTYRREHAEDAVEITNDGNTLTVNVSYCPGVQYLRETGRNICKWYPETTTVVMQTLAEQGSYQFTMHAYDDATGAASYSFTRCE